MHLKINLQNKLIRITVFILLVIITVLLGRLILLEFLIGTFSDERVSNDEVPGILAVVEYAPNSPYLRERLAELQFQEGQDLEAARDNIERAIKYSPNDYKLYLLKARIYEASNRKLEAESAFLDAIRLAPNYTEVYWQAGNFYFRQNETAKAIEHFQVVADLNPPFIPPIFDLAWSLSGGDVAVLKKIAKENSASRLNLAIFLAKKCKAQEAEEIFSNIDKKSVKNNPELNSFFVNLLLNDYPLAAQRSWLQANEIKNESGIFNGGFEVTDFSGPTEFNWDLRKNKFVQLTLDQKERYEGQNSLLIDFKGQETTTLTDEIRHILILPPNKKMRLIFFVKTEKLLTEEAPKIVVEISKDKLLLGVSEPIRAGTNDWQCMGFDFNTPKAPEKGDSRILHAKVVKQPKYAFEEPTYGRIWLDNFAVGEGRMPC
jgi:tetratricopeptide (TPR) repeat protein